MARLPTPETDGQSLRRLDQLVLNWTCSDPTKIVTTVADSELKRWASGRRIKVRYQAFEESATQHVPGLRIWAAWELGDVESICTSIAKQRRLERRSTIQMVYADHPLMDQRAMFVQSGAHAVLHPFTQLPRAIQSIASQIRLSRETGSPLTQGLMDRLPWGTVNRKSPDAPVGEVG